MSLLPPRCSPAACPAAGFRCPAIRMSPREVSSPRGLRAACCSCQKQLRRHVLGTPNTRSGYNQYAIWLRPIHVLVTTNTQSGYDQYGFWVTTNTQSGYDQYGFWVTTNTITHAAYTRYDSYHSADA